VAGRIPPTELVELEAQRRFFGSGVPAHLREVAGAIAVALPIARSTMLNRVTGLGLSEPATEANLDEIEAFFAPLRVQYAIAVAPHAQPPELTGMLAQRGFTTGYAWTKFVRSTGDAAATMTDLRVDLVGPDAGDDFALVVREGYELPEAADALLARAPGLERFSCYVAYAGDTPAAAGALAVTGKTGWFGFAATRPAFRRRGGQNAIMAARVRRAGELGVRTLVTETGERVPGRPSNSYRNIVRNGFRPAYVRQNFVSPPWRPPSGRRPETV
jgi:GNAT acetyltransferase-like protein